MSAKESEAFDVWEAWRSKQRRPQHCRFTKERKSLILKRLNLGYTVEDFKALFEYAWGSKSAEVRWWRGENPNRTRYLDLENLLVESKLGRRIENALNWKEDGVDELPEPVSSHHGQTPEVRRGSLAVFRGEHGAG